MTALVLTALSVLEIGQDIAAPYFIKPEIKEAVQEQQATLLGDPAETLARLRSLKGI